MSVQGTPEWYAERLGKVTASRISDMMAKTKTGWGASRANYVAQLVAERLSGTQGETFTNAAMKWGTEMEPEARSAYSFYADCTVQEVGFIQHPSIPMAGASPDGHIADDGSVEIKCPETKTHIETLLGGAIPSKYALQMQWQMACSGRQWCDFVSYDPRMPEHMRLFVRRLARDNATIASLEAEVRAFLKEVDGQVLELRAKYPDQREAA